MRVSSTQSLTPKAFTKRAGLTCVNVGQVSKVGISTSGSTNATEGITVNIRARVLAKLFAILLISLGTNATAQDESIPFANASLGAAFYADSSCLLTVDSLVQTGQTIIDADVDDAGSRMLIHCDTEEGRRLTLLARGDALNVAQRVPLLTRAQIQEGEFGMIAWLTRAADDTAPRRYVVGGNVILRKSPPADVAGYALHTQRQSFAQLSGTLEPILTTGSSMPFKVVPMDSEIMKSNPPDSHSTDSAVHENTDEGSSN